MIQRRLWEGNHTRSLCALMVFIHDWTFTDTWTTSLTDLSWSLPPPGSTSCSPNIRSGALPTFALTPQNLVPSMELSVCSWLFLPRLSLKVKGRAILDFSQIVTVFQPKSQVFGELTLSLKSYIYGQLIISKDAKTVHWGEIVIPSTNDYRKTESNIQTKKLGLYFIPYTKVIQTCHISNHKSQNKNHRRAYIIKFPWLSNRQWFLSLFFFF